MLLIFGGGGIAEGIRACVPEAIVLARTDCNVTNSAQVENAFRKYKPTHVVNCAGVSDEKQPHWTLDVNLHGSLNILQSSTVPTVMIASVAGLYGKPDHPAYCASKAGVISLVQAYAGMGRRCWAVSPGRVDTKMRQHDYPDDTPGSRLSPEQVGMLVAEILLHEKYPPGTNVIIRKQGLDRVIIEQHRGDGWKDKLRVGYPKTI